MTWIRTLGAIVLLAGWVLRESIVFFWRQAVHRAAGQVETARAARCVERS